MVALSLQAGNIKLFFFLFTAGAGMVRSGAVPEVPGENSSHEREAGRADPLVLTLACSGGGLLGGASSVLVEGA